MPDLGQIKTTRQIGVFGAGEGKRGATAAMPAGVPSRSRLAREPFYLWWLCLHEAGHCAAIEALGGRWRRVVLLEGAGRCVFDDTLDASQRAVMAASGPLAPEMMYLKAPRPMGAPAPRSSCEGAGDIGRDSEIVAAAPMPREEAERAAREIVADCWDAILTLATKLYTTGEVKNAKGTT